MKIAITMKAYALVAAISSTGATFSYVHNQSVDQMGSCWIYKASKWFGETKTSASTANAFVKNSKIANTFRNDFGAFTSGHAQKSISQGLARNNCGNIP